MVSASLKNNPVISRLRGLVEAVPESSQELGRYDFRFGATVMIETKDGGRYRSTVNAPFGSARRGIDWLDVDAKLRTLMRDADHAPGKIEQLLGRIHSLDTAEGISE